ncbi:hypothetical protein [Calothrix sp. 336/3]|uniref:hypothetical protein n=1 Tax=Calothrix sp. 336/3 TaxID=1337936 RepID=UPI0004E2BF16|nr:hypothetical protein [Calothrix sp. 336/3]AKG24924.1 hypothetical protein IJ00_26665 [Calothrix sp. 336/3]
MSTLTQFHFFPFLFLCAGCQSVPPAHTTDNLFTEKDCSSAYFVEDKILSDDPPLLPSPVRDFKKEACQEVYAMRQYPGKGYISPEMYKFYLEGTGVPKDYPTGIQYLFACKGNYSSTCSYDLAIYFRDGKYGLPKDSVMAYVYFHEDYNNFEAYAARKALEKTMTTEQRKEAKNDICRRVGIDAERDGFFCTKYLKYREYRETASRIQRYIDTPLPLNFRPMIP